MLSFVELDHAIGLLRFAINEAHVVQLRAADDDGNADRTFLFIGFVFRRRRRTHDPVALAIGPVLQQQDRVAQFERADIGRP